MIDDSFVIRQARPRDAAAVLRLLDEATEWLAGRGMDQWQDFTERRAHRVRADIAIRALWVVTHLGRVVATITVDEMADTDFWNHKDRVRTALYAHRMAVARAYAGRHLGAAMLDWAAERVVRKGRTKLRLDAWSTNENLHLYYKNLGFEMVRNFPVAGRGSGALFERPALDRSGLGPMLHLHRPGARPEQPATSVVRHDEPSRGDLVPA